VPALALVVAGDAQAAAIDAPALAGDAPAQPQHHNIEGYGLTVQEVAAYLSLITDRLVL